MLLFKSFETAGDCIEAADVLGVPN